MARESAISPEWTALHKALLMESYGRRPDRQGKLRAFGPLSVCPSSTVASLHNAPVGQFDWRLKMRVMTTETLFSLGQEAQLQISPLRSKIPPAERKVIAAFRTAAGSMAFVAHVVGDYAWGVLFTGGKAHAGRFKMDPLRKNLRNGTLSPIREAQGMTLSRVVSNYRGVAA